MALQDDNSHKINEEFIQGPPAPVNERYFTKYYTSTQKSEDGPTDQCVLRHSNKICVICIAPSHSIISNDMEIERVEFRDGSCDLSKNSVHGKRKRGGYQLTPKSVLCQVTCKDGSIFILRSCIKGFLIEVNEKLMVNLDLLKTKPLSDGYLAIMTQRLSDTSLQDLSS